ncbi:uncharacterized protein LOC134214559 [Armigeres subalbatus]|uniref:uncharacterized protein LOC134214559 n=1 Tax=Armigeres subalbatus TaxID=124917 RepID=UPI002ED44584
MAENSKKRVTAVEVIKTLTRVESDVIFCAIDPTSKCQYSQAKFDSGNFARHFRNQHLELAIINNLCKAETPAKKPKAIPKLPVAINKPTFMEGCMKLVTIHHLPLTCFEWEGLKLIIDPISEALNVKINRKNIKLHLEATANRIKQVLIKEMRGKLISVKLDSASRHHRHILGINVQYELHGAVVIRTLAMMEVKQSQTAKFLKDKILEVLDTYGVTIHQIFSVTTDNGANMIAAIKELKTCLSKQLIDGEEASKICLDDDDDESANNETDMALLENLIMEFRNQLSLVRCAVHTLQLAVGDVIKKNDANIARITKVVKETRKTKYTLYFEHKNASKAPLWCITRWGGRYEMINSIVSQEFFYKEIGQEHKELELFEGDWNYMKHFVAAFKPVYELTKKMQEKHCSLNDFYISWLQATCMVEKEIDNPFHDPLLETLNTRLKLLMENMVFKAAIFLDPRLNFLGSKLFASVDEREAVMNFIINTYNRIVNTACVSSTPSSSTNVQSTPAPDCVNKDVSDELEDYITRMIGGCSANISGTPSFHIQLRQLEVEPRQPHHYDVWNHWLARKRTHPELYAVAMVVLAAPSNQVSVERAFSALALVLSDLRTGLAEKTLEEILLVKLNREIFQKVVASPDDA